MSFMPARQGRFISAAELAEERARRDAHPLEVERGRGAAAQPHLLFVLADGLGIDVSLFNQPSPELALEATCHAVNGEKD